MKAIILLKRMLRYIFNIMFLPLWHLEKLIPRDPKLWIFGSLEGKGYGDNSGAFFEYTLARHPEIKARWITKNRGVYHKLHSGNMPVCFAYSLQGLALFLRAKLYITDHGNYDLNIYTGNGAINIFLWHGMPLKAIGMFNDEYIKENIKPRFFRQLSNYLSPYGKIDNIDITIATSEFFIPFLSSGFANILGKALALEKIAVTGLPRNDKLFSPKEQPLLNRLREKYKNCRIVFYMPTFRLGGYTDVPFSAFSGFNFDQNAFTEFLESQNLVFLFKPHPCDNNLPVFAITERFIYLTGDEYDDLYLFLGKVDILATDYSSVYFDFLLTKKPVILMPFDYDEYMKIRGMFFDYYAHMQGAKAHDWNDFMRIIRQREYYAAQDIALFNKFQDDHSCERVFDAVASLLRRSGIYTGKEA
jgi:CDP-glycerol glycerophosphotransferase